MTNKYFAVFKISWEQATTYRLNFALWRVRLILGLLMTYFVWWTVFKTQKQIFGYTEGAILSYILVAAVMRAIIISSRVMDVAGQIAQGDVVNFLVKPLNFIRYYFYRDIADKLLNILFVVFETILLIWLFRPPIIIQTNPATLMLCLLSVVLGLILFFTITFTVGMFAFWMEDAWAPFMLLYIFLESLGGGLFPIDILPKAVSTILLLTPFPYLLYFPTKVYLGTLTSVELLTGFSILTFWVIFLWYLMLKVYRAGLRHYSSFGG